MTWFDFKLADGGKAFVNSDAITCITEVAGGRTELSFANGGGLVVAEPIDEVIAEMFERVDNSDTFTADSTEIDYGE